MSENSHPLSQPAGTVIEDVYVDVFYRQSHTAPFSTSIVSVRTRSVLNRAGVASFSTQTLLQLATTDPAGSSRIRSTVTPVTARAAVSASHASSAPAIVDNVSGGQNASSAIIALSIGLPLGVFCLGFSLIMVLLWWRKRRAAAGTLTDLDQKSPIGVRHSGTWARLFAPQTPSISEQRPSPFCPDTGATIKYKIAPIDAHAAAARNNPYRQHVLTPQKAAFPMNRSSSSHRIETLLYSKPPGIQHITSAMQSSCTLENPSNESEKLPNNAKWSYESPLSRWFLTKSTYFQDQVTQPLKSSTVKLKQLNILSRVSKSRVQSFLPDEASPILSEANRSPVFHDSYVKSRLDPLVYRSSSLNYSKSSVGDKSQEFDPEQPPKYSLYSGQSMRQGPIKPQVICEPNLTPQSLSRVPTLSDGISKASIAPVSTSSSRKKDKRHNKKLKLYLEQAHTLKPLPLTPKSWQNSVNREPVKYESPCPDGSSANDPPLDEIHVVVRNYTPKLMDEITINCGEHVRLLARHTDGWCLVEKCELTGSPLYKNAGPEHKEIDGEYYLNEYRGIIPGVCLKQIGS